ncbi:MAG: alpha/beta fold hydrolase [Bacteroidota bacterium]
MDTVIFSDDQHLKLVHNGLNIRLNGRLNTANQVINGFLHVDSSSTKVTLTRTPQAKRTQTIVPPLPYYSEEVFFYNKDSTRLAGTLTTPKQGDSFAAVVLVSGSGPQDRNSEILGHKPFEILADHLTRKGIAVLRYDDRGYGASHGQFRPATTLDYTYDALAAVNFLKTHPTQKFNKIGIIGHSEGGNIAPVAATMDSSVNFIVLLAAPGLSNYDFYLISLDLIMQETPETYDRDFPFFKSVYKDMATIDDKEILKDSLQRKFASIVLQMSEEELIPFNGADAYVKSMVAYHTSDWYHYFLQFDVTPYLEKLTIPILALNGDQDTSVEAAANLRGIQQILERSGNNNFEVVPLKNVNHFFQESKDAKIESVYFNEITFSREALVKIEKWIQQRVQN